MQILLRTLTFLDGITEVLGRIAAIFAPLMLLLTCYIVISRYLFNSGSVAIAELVTYSNALLFTLGAGYTLKHNGHVRVDIFYSEGSKRAQAWINLGGTLFLLLPVMSFITWVCWSYVASAWRIHEGSADAGGLPYVYLLKTLILVMGVSLIVQGVAEALRNILLLCNSTGDDAATLEEETLV